MVAIPTGAKHARLAFDFAKYTLWDYGYVQGPTTNGYTVIGHSKSGNNFTITKTAGGAPTRTCSPANTGACPQSQSW